MPEHVTPPVGAIIRARRIALGLTQTALARAIGVSHDSIISRWESGTNKPGPLYLKALAEVLGGSIADYLGD